MPLHDEFLQQAFRLATRDGSNQADLRRAVSASYYGLFHLLIAEASQVVSPASPSGLAAKVGRGFSHATMQDVCKAFATGPLKAPISGLVVPPIEPSLRLVARHFIELQNQRIIADYDTDFVADEPWARNAVRFAIKANLEWRVIKGSVNANVFLTALAFHRLWGKGA